LIVLSRSGKTTETTWAVEEFETRFPGRTILIGCNPLGPLAEMASLKVFLTESAENTIAQTRSLSAMYLSALMMAALYSGNQQVLDILGESPQLVNGILQKSEPVIQSLFEDRAFKNIFILGSGPLYGIAREAGLKCMEMSTTDTFSYQFLESRHGPRALIDENTLVVGLYSHAGLMYEARVMEELSVIHKAVTLAVTPADNWNTGEVSAAISVDAGWPDGLTGLPYLPVTQLVAYYAASSKGLNPDVARFHSPYVVIQRY
jgi:fructoselysine-6-P-deglycase FrlB-like protein